MKTLYTKLTAAFVLSTAITIPTLSQAEIHFSQAQGMLENTQDDKKKFSPFWGMVALHGKMLETIRFFGNYDTTSNTAALEGDAENIRTVDVGRDPIVILIKRLFNSPDGVQFVATTYEGDPVGNLSRHLEKINDIIEILSTAQQTPLPSSKSSSSDEEKIENEEKINQIKQLIQRQKSEEIRVKLVLSEIKKEQVNSSMTDDERKIALEKNKLIDQQIEKIKGNLKQFVEEIKAKTTAIKLSMEKQKDSGPKKNLAEAIARVLDKGTAPEDQEIQRKNLEFAHHLGAAFKAQETLANPSKPDSYLYPENIVITSLLAFFVKVADDKSEVMVKLPYLMKHEGLKDYPNFDKESYYQFKADFGVDTGTLFPALLKNPELAFLMQQGFDAYENPYMQPVNYSGSTPYGTDTFPDCGETSLRNVLGIFLSAGNGGVITPLVIEELIKKLQDRNPDLVLDETSPFMKMITFFQQPSYSQKSATTDSHKQWAEIVSNLNEGKAPVTLNDVQYGYQINKSGANVYEIKSNIHSEVKGIVNMFNVIAKLIPDGILNEPWSQDQSQRFLQIAKKLDRLCELLSRKGMTLSWRNRTTKDQSITTEFETIVFEGNQIPVFDWVFSPGHFQFYCYAITQNDWRVKYRTEDEELFQNEWMAGLYLKLNEGKFIEEAIYGTKFPLSLIFTPDLRGLDGATNVLSFILWKGMMQKKMENFHPLIPRWIEKSIPLNDPHALDKISLLFLATDDQPIVKDILGNQKYKPIHKAIVTLKNTSSINPLQDAANENRNAILIMISKGHPEYASLSLYQNYKITDAVVSKLTNLTSLNLEGNSTITDEAVSKLTKLTSLNLMRNSTITDFSVSHLINLNNLNLSENRSITDAGISQLTKLTTLILNKNNLITDEGISKLINLKSLSLSWNTKITDAALLKLPNLSILNLKDNYRISRAALSQHSNFENIRIVIY